MKSLMGDLTILENIIFSNGEYDKNKEKARKIHAKILGNYKLTKGEQKFIESFRRGEVVQ